MAVKTRPDFFSVSTGIDTTQIYRTSRLVSELTGFAVQANKAIVGRNAFAHEAGIHQDGIIKRAITYEIIDALQIVDGYRSLKKMDAVRMYRDSKLTQIFEGTNQIQRLVIARQLIKELMDT
jgi:isopropylmalate/homocitrate/citramalate synthase